MPEDKQSFLSKLHVDPTIHVGHLLTTLSMVACIVVWGMNVNQRVALLEARQEDTVSRIVVILEHQRDIDARQDAVLGETRQIIREDMRDINVKLDNLIRVYSQRRAEE